MDTNEESQNRSRWEGFLPQLELLTVSILPRPSADFWAETANATTPITRAGGTFSGPFLSGVVVKTIVSGYYHAQQQSIEIIARAEMLTDTGVMIRMTDHGTWRGTEGAIQSLIDGDMVAISQYYFIGVVKYSVEDPRYLWLEEGDYLSRGEMAGDQLKISQYRLVHPLGLAEWKTRLSADERLAFKFWNFRGAWHALVSALPAQAMSHS